MQRQQFGSGAPWEAVVGYSRVVRVGPFVAVAGTTATGDDGSVIGEGDAAAQTTAILAKIGRALATVGASFQHVVRSRLFVTNIDDWEAVGRAHGAVFASIRPVATMVEVSRLIDPRHLVEIEVDAIVPER